MLGWEITFHSMMNLLILWLGDIVVRYFEKYWKELFFSHFFDDISGWKEKNSSLMNLLTNLGNFQLFLFEKCWFRTERFFFLVFNEPLETQIRWHFLGFWCLFGTESTKMNFLMLSEIPTSILNSASSPWNKRRNWYTTNMS